jgi:hypothetical protein
MRQERCVFSGVVETPRLAYFIPRTSQLFFWFFPPGPEGSLDDLIFWYAVENLVLNYGTKLNCAAFQDKWRSRLFVAGGFFPRERCRLSEPYSQVQRLTRL